MLGTNDLKLRFSLPASDIASGIGVLVDIVQKSAAGPQGHAPAVLEIITERNARLERERDPGRPQRERIDRAVRNRKGNEEMLAQLAELEEQQRRVQFSWEHGRLLPEEYLARTSQLEREIASMRPLDYDRLEEAADLITHFRSYWEQCAEVDNPEEARQQLMAKIVDRVFVYDDRV